MLPTTPGMTFSRIWKGGAALPGIRLCSAVGLLLLAACGGQGGGANGTSATATASAVTAARAALAPTGNLRVAVVPGNALLAHDTPSGAAGVAIDLGQALAARLGVSFRMISYRSPADVVAAAAGRAWDVAFLAVDPARVNAVDFTAPYMLVANTYLFGPNAPVATASGTDTPGVRIVSVAGFAPALYLQRTLKYARLSLVDSPSAAVQALTAGSANAFAFSRFQLSQLAAKVTGAHLADDDFLEVQQAVALPKGLGPSAMAYVERFLRDSKASGLVARAIAAQGATTGVQVTPA